MWLVIERSKALADRIYAGLDNLDLAGHRELIRALVLRIEIDHGQIDVVFRIPDGPSRSDESAVPSDPSGTRSQPCQIPLPCGRSISTLQVHFIDYVDGPCSVARRSRSFDGTAWQTSRALRNARPVLDEDRTGLQRLGATCGARRSCHAPSSNPRVP